MDVPGWPVAFRGSLAVRAGLVTRGRLRGPRFIRVFPDVYCRAADEQTLTLRSLAAYQYVEPRGGVVSGYSAAELHRASCAGRDAPAEVTVPDDGRGYTGLVVHRDALRPDEVTVSGGIRLTRMTRTAYDLARWAPDLTEAVVAVDALARAGRFDPGALRVGVRRYPRARGNDRIPEVLAHAEPKSGSPMESRLRMLLVLAGLPRPVAQHPVQYPRMRQAVWLDLAYPEKKIGIEYEGADHLTEDGVLRDADRYTRLVDDEWRIYRYTKWQVYREQERIVGEIRRAVARAGRDPAA